MQSTYVLWRGNSAHNGEPIRLVASNIVTASQNPKTGPMVQLWILPDSTESLSAIVKRGDDESICGNCHLRPFIAKQKKRKVFCYVRVYQAPNSVHRSTHDKPTEWKAGWKAIAQSRRRVRVGAHGGIDALPEETAIEVMQKIAALK
jgi:hypothetical protein